MSDNIELVIKIPEKTYKHILSMQFYIPGLRSDKSLLEEILKAIRTGVSLPKGHGRLIDADKLVPDCREDFEYYDDDEHNVFTAVGIAQIECADTIIKADKESENKE